LPKGVKVNAVSLLHSESKIPFRVEESRLRFTIPRVDDYEVAAVTVA
jgi:hypothetical protein